MNKRAKKTIGIVGGAGPMAGALLMKKIIRNCQKFYGCLNDYDYPKIIVLSYPFSEMLKPNTYQQKEYEVYRQLKEALDFLINNGADYLAIACNTLHSFLNDAYFKNDRLLNLIEETQLYMSKQKFSKVLVLCTNTSAQRNVHKSSLIQLPSSEEQIIVDGIIKTVLKGSFSLKDSRSLKAFILSKAEQDPNIDGVLLGCSEISLLLDEFPVEISKMNIIDPLDILSSKLCKLTCQSKENNHDSF